MIDGWINGDLDPESWQLVLESIAAYEDIPAIRRSASELLQRGSAQQESTSPFGVTLLPLADALSEALWSAPDDLDVGIETTAWLDRAVSCWSGKLALYWIHRVQMLWTAAPDHWHGLDHRSQAMLERALDGGDARHAFARTVIASQLHFLVAADLEWTTVHVLPCFDWARNHEEAGQAWDGYLTWGRPPTPLLPVLLPHYLECIDQIGTAISKGDRLLLHLASIALYSSTVHPGPDSWLEQAISKLRDEDRITWAASVTRELRDAPKDLVRSAFETWIEQYWDRRLRGVPIPLSEGEGFEMVDWSLQANDRFPAVVKLIAASPIARSDSHRMFFGSLRESGLADRFPLDTAQLLARIVQTLDGPVYDPDDLEQLVRQLARLAGDHDGVEAHLTAVREEAIRLRFTKALDWH